MGFVDLGVVAENPLRVESGPVVVAAFIILRYWTFPDGWDFPEALKASATSGTIARPMITPIVGRSRGCFVRRAARGKGVWPGMEGGTRRRRTAYRGAEAWDEAIPLVTGRPGRRTPFGHAVQGREAGVGAQQTENDAFRETVSAEAKLRTVTFTVNDIVQPPSN
jgi:hypothetical protein